MLSLASKPDSIGAELQQLMALPCIARLGEVFPLVRAAALGTLERGARNAFADERHVAQVVEVEPRGVEALARSGQFERSKLADLAERALESAPRTERTCVLAHQRLQAHDFCSRIHRWAFRCGGRAAGNRRHRRRGSERSRATSGASA